MSSGHCHHSHHFLPTSCPLGQTQGTCRTLPLTLTEHLRKRSQPFTLTNKKTALGKFNMTSRTGGIGGKECKELVKEGNSAGWGRSIKFIPLPHLLHILPPQKGSPQPAPQSPRLPVVVVSNSIVLPGTEANGVINYLLSAGLSSECDQYPLLSFRAARLCSPSPTPHSSGTAGPRTQTGLGCHLRPLSDSGTENEVAPQN